MPNKKATGAAAMSETITLSAGLLLDAVKLHLSAAGGTASENFEVAIDSGVSTAYDTLLLAQDMNTTADLLWIPDQPLKITEGDALDFTWANANTRTWGLEVTYRNER